MLNPAAQTFPALVMTLSSFLGYWLVWSLSGPSRPLEPKLTQNGSTQSDPRLHS
jgi:hypothetical protein